MTLTQRLKVLAGFSSADTTACATRTAVVEPLEARTMFSADVLSVPPEPAEQSLDDDPIALSVGASATHSNPPVELVFVDQRVLDADLLIRELESQRVNGRPLDIHLVQHDQEGLALISSVLSSASANAVHIISHGSTSGFQLGNSWVDAQFAAEQSAALESWRDGLTDDADIMLYGCHLAESAEGRDLSLLLAGLTNADVATSTNTTGHVNLGGDWILEHHTGSIETDSIGSSSLAAAWEHELLTGTNGIDILYGDDAQDSDPNDFDLIGNDGNDFLIATDDLLKFTIGSNVLEAGSFLYDPVQIPFYFDESQNDVTTDTTGIEINSGSVDFIMNGDQGLDVPGGGRALVLQDAEISTDLPLTAVGTPYTLAFYMGGLSSGVHEMEIALNGTTETVSVTMPGGNSLGNMNWTWAAIRFSPDAGYDNPTKITARAITGDPIIAAVRLVDHTVDNGDITLDGGDGDDLVLGAGGNDTINSGAGNDYIDAGTGNDLINDGEGDDLVFAGIGSDTINDGIGDDRIHGGADDDIINDGPGDDTAYGGAGNDVITDGPGSDRLFGGLNDDTIYIMDSSATDTNLFNGGLGNDAYVLGNRIDANFEIDDNGGSDTLVLEYNTSRGDSTYFLPDNFTLTNKGIEDITGSGSSNYTLGEASYSNPLAWDLSDLSAISSTISIQGGTGNDSFGIAFTDTQYRGGEGTDVVRIYGNSTDYAYNRTTYTSPSTSDDTQYITVFSGTDSDVFFDTIEYIDFDNARYDIARDVLTTRPATVTNEGPVPSIVVEQGETTFIDLSALDIQDSELAYAVDNDTSYEFSLRIDNGSLSALNNNGTTQTVSPPDYLTTTNLLSEFNSLLDDPNRFSYQSDTSSVQLTDTLKIGSTDPNKTGVGGAFSTIIDIPISILHDPVLAGIESASLVYTENSPEVVVTSTITLTDPNTTPIESATVVLKDHSAADVLNFTDTATIASAYDANTGTLTLTGNDSVAAYQAALRSITFENTSENPDTADRTLEISVYDGHDHSNVASRKLVVNDVNDSPAFSSLSTASTDEDTQLELSLNDVLALSDASDIDGSVDTFVVVTDLSGTLHIGADAASALPFSAGSNHLINAVNQAYWTPSAEVNTPADGLQSAFSIQAQDDDGSTTANSVTLQVNVSEVNDLPTLSNFSTEVDSTDEDTQLQITLAELLAVGDQADIDGTIEAMVVRSVDSGTLHIGPGAATASAFVTGSNDTIDATTHAYWTPEANRNTPSHGNQQAFSVVAQDDDEADSTTPVAVSIRVNDINDAPSISTFGVSVGSTNEDTLVRITLAELLANSDASDIDGNVDAVVVRNNTNGELRIGSDAVSASPFAAGSNDTIDTNNHAFWQPYSNVNSITNGTQIAFFGSIVDNDGAQSLIAPGAIIQVNDVNDTPIFSAFGSDVAVTTEDTVVEITLAALLAAGNATDIDGTIANMRVQSVSSGTLVIGADLTSATPFAAGSNDVISTTSNAYWTPDHNANTATDGKQTAFSVIASDDDGAFSTTPVAATVQVNDANDPPTLTTFTGSAEITDEDIEVEVTFAELITVSNADDTDGTVEALVVTSVESGTLRIGSSSALATAFVAGSNDTIDSTRQAYWTPATNVNTATDGTQLAFSVLAQDNDSATSAGAVAVTVTVADINDAPTLSTFNGHVDQTDEDVEASITLAELISAGNASDIDGSIEAMVVGSVTSGTLKIGTSSSTAQPWLPGTNDTIDANRHAYWTPDPNVNTATDGAQLAFSVTAKDNDADTSAVAVPVQVAVNDINDPPTLTAFNGAVDQTDEDVEASITLAELISAGNASDIDGSIEAMVVGSVTSGTLNIGSSNSTAQPWLPGTNDTIDATRHAYWTPDPNVNTATDGAQLVFSVTAQDNDADTSAVAVPVQVTVNDINDPPTLTAFNGAVDQTNEDTQVRITLNELLAAGDDADIDGNINTLVVTDVVSGTLKIGANARTAQPWATGSNDTVSTANHAFWTPDVNLNTATDGAQLAFSVIAQDDDGDTSAFATAVEIAVNDVNDHPVLTAFNNDITTTDEDTEVPINLADLIANSDTADVDGNIDAMVVSDVVSGLLRIGIDFSTAQPWVAGSNDVIDATHRGYWTPAPEHNTATNGKQSAIAVMARDNDGSLSATPVETTVLVRDVNDNPQIADAAQISTLEDTLLTLHLTDLLAVTGATDSDGNVAAFQITNSINGTLLIGTTPESAQPITTGANDIINAANSAFWLPDDNQNTTTDGYTGQLSVVAIDNDRGYSQTTAELSVTVIQVNDSPTGTDSTITIAEDTDYTLRPVDFGFSDATENDRFAAIIIGSLPVNGEVLHNGSRLAEGDSVSAEDIEDGLLVFSPLRDTFGESETGLSFQVRDSGGTDNTGVDTDPAANIIHFNISAVNDAPQLQLGTMGVDEGATLLIDNNMLIATDVDNSALQLTYTLTVPPQHGHLQLEQTALTSGEKFTAQDVNDGKLSYQHDSSEIDRDTFTLELSDGTEFPDDVITETASIVVNEVTDAAPSISDLTIRIEYGQSVDTIEQSERGLLEGLDDNFTIEIIKQPQRGSVELQDNGHYTYRHGGGLILKDSFTYRVTNEDGVYSDATVTIDIEPPFLRALPQLLTAVATSAPEPEIDEPEIPAAAAKPTPEETQPAPTTEPEPQEPLQQQDNAFVSQKAESKAIASNTSTVLAVPVEFALATKEMFTPENEFIDRVIQHRQWTQDRFSNSTEIASLSNSMSVSNVKLNDLFRMDFKYAENRNDKLVESFDQQRELMRNTVPTNFEFGTKAITVSSGLSIGYLVWLIRGGVLLGSVMSSMPAWRTFDPLPVLNGMSADTDDADNESLESLVEEDDPDDSETPDDDIKKPTPAAD